MKKKFIIILAITFINFLLPTKYAHSYGGGGSGGGTSATSVGSSDVTTPPAGFEPTDTVKDQQPSSTTIVNNLGTTAINWVNNNTLEGIKNSVIVRVPTGDSCVEASKDRAAALADHIRDKIKSGELDIGSHTVKIGSRSGYQIPYTKEIFGDAQDWSFHTYTVIQIYDANNNFVGGYEVDTYVADFVLPHGQVDLVNENPDHVQTITSPSKAGK